MLKFGEIVVDVVIVSLVRHPNMLFQFDVSRSIEDSHRNSGPIVVKWLPEEGGPAIVAEPSTDFIIKLIPFDILFARYFQRFFRNFR